MSDSTQDSHEPIRFATAQEAETAFYAAFQRADLDAMQAVWLAADYVECIHPMGERLRGIEAVMAGWRRILEPGPVMSFELADVGYTQSGTLSIHTVTENITLRQGDQHLHSRVLATNIYVLTQAGWRLMLHHASPMPNREPEASPAVVH
ncbi:MAG TPA: nuclear transport factor 2 family protein [Gammaproteobacteria bacterium]|nr:nuclear transport factor 2 family protein [Gammaproteobacteria bacterium]